MTTPTTTFPEPAGAVHVVIAAADEADRHRSMMEHTREKGLTNRHTPWWTWIVVGSVPVTFLLGGMIARTIAASRGGLDDKEMAV